MRDSLRKNISRRRFLQMVGTSAVLGGAVYLSGCGSGGESATEAPAAEATATEVSAPAPTPTQALKTLRFVVSEPAGPADTADPALITTYPDYALGSMIGDLLVWIDDDYKVQPMLAESWESNDKADVWDFKIRQDVKFHTGAKLTAKDIIYTYQRVLDPDTGSPGKGEMGGLDPDVIEAVDDYTVRFSLPYPIVELPLLLNNGHVFIVQDGATTEDLRQGDFGTGPFKLEQFIPGEEPYVFVKNEDYWMEGLPKVDVIEMRFIGEPAARIAALERNQVDVIEDPPLDAVKRLEDNPETKVVSTRTGSWDSFIMMVDTPPFDNNDLRLAMKYCVDRQKMVDLVLQGYGSVANDVPVAPWIEYGIDEPPRPQDIAKAKEHLAKAGYPDGIDLTLNVSNTRPNWLTAATLFKEMCGEAGINIELVLEAADTYWSEVWMKEPFCMTGWSARPADAMLSVAYLSDAEWNETHFYRPEFDELLEEARQTVDYDARKALYQEAQRVVIEEGGSIIPYFMDALAATRPNVTDWKPAARRIIYDLRTIDLT